MITKGLGITGLTRYSPQFLVIMTGHDIHEAIRDLCSLGMMRDGNSFVNLNDKKTFFLVVDQAFVELIANPFGLSLTTYGIKEKRKKM